MFKLNITITDDVFDENKDIVIVEKTLGYRDVDHFEMSEMDFAYRIAEIARDEIKKIKMERQQTESKALTEEELQFLADNQTPY